MASYFNYEIQEFSIETNSKGVIDFTTSVSFISYSENITSPMTYVDVLISDTVGALSKYRIRGGEKIFLKIFQPATTGSFKLDDKNTYYIANIEAAASQSTREFFKLTLVPREYFTNETSRVFQRFDNTIEASVQDILKNPTERGGLNTSRFNSSNLEKTSNKYSFFGGARKPFTVLGWLCPKAIPGESGNEKGTAGYLFFENINGYNFKSVDTLFNVDARQVKATFSYRETIADTPADQRVNFEMTSMPVFTKAVNILDNLRIGMYASINYFFDTNTRKFYKNKYTLKDSYDIMKHSSDKSHKEDAPSIPEGFEDSPSRLMVSMLDSGQMDKSGKLEAVDKRME